MVSNIPGVMISLIKTFLNNCEVTLDECSSVFTISRIRQPTDIVGKIDETSFEHFRESVIKILGLSNKSTDKPKYKSERARLLCEKIEKSKLKKNSTADPNYSLENMILKYCTYNTVGINMLNIWNLTYYQFMKLFRELAYCREVSYINSIAANTFSFSEENAKSFEKDLWIKK